MLPVLLILRLPFLVMLFLEFLLFCLGGHSLHPTKTNTCLPSYSALRYKARRAFATSLSLTFCGRPVAVTGMSCCEKNST